MWWSEMPRSPGYRAAEGAPGKRSITGTGGKVEVLGDGQQLVVDGSHGSGAALRWRPAPPWAASRDDLAAVTEDAVAGFLAAAAPLIGSPGEAAPAPGCTGGGGGDSRDDAALVRAIVTGENYHASLPALAARLVARHVTPDATRDILLGLMLSHPEPSRDDRWRERVASIPGIVRSAAAKFEGPAEARRAIARQAGRRLRDGADFQQVMEEARAFAEQQGMGGEQAARIVRWIAKQELARRAAHG